MKIKIYQINQDRDKNRVKFCGLEDTEQYQGIAQIDPTLYDEVFSGEVDCKTLEGVYTLFNTDHPPFHRGHSMSLSDIVEVTDAPELVGRIRFHDIAGKSVEVEYTDSEKYNGAIAEARDDGLEITAVRLEGKQIPSVNPGFYFCDCIGFESVDFDASKAVKPDNLLRVVALEPGKPAYAAEVADGLRFFQQAVRGRIENAYPFEDNAVLVCNEEGLINDMDVNRIINGTPYFGTAFIIGDKGDGSYCSLTDEQTEQYLDEFQSPELSDQDEESGMTMV